MHPNRKAFLDTLAYSEGTRTGQHPLTKHDGYDVIVTGVDEQGKRTYEVFTDFSRHPFADGRPPKRINSKGLYSSAAGRYQHMRVHWPHYRDQLQLPDFGPDSQDKWAIQLIRERGALPLIDGGNFAEAIRAVRSLWASLPGAGHNQHENDLDKLAHAYEQAGGTFA